jgi:hypothetical protein
MLKFNWLLSMFVMLLCLCCPSWAGDVIPEGNGYIAAGVGQVEIDAFEGHEDSTFVALGFTMEDRMSAEFEVEKYEDMTQYTGRVIGDVIKMGDHSFTLQFGYSYGEIEVLGEEIGDGYLTYGVGYQWRIAQPITFRVMYNIYDIDDFDGVEIGDANHASVSLVYNF